MLIYTIGHSTRSIEDFLQILDAFGVKQLADIRTIPRSRHNPQYNEQELSDALNRHGIGYSRLVELGGLRHTTQDSINTAWRNAAFRGFADYMQTPEFTVGISKLIDLSQASQSVIMCAEAVPWRCHRSLIGDALLARGVQVEDIYDEKTSKPHKLTPWAKVDGMIITYPVDLLEKTPG